MVSVALIRRDNADGVVMVPAVIPTKLRTSPKPEILLLW